MDARDRHYRDQPGLFDRLAGLFGNAAAGGIVLMVAAVAAMVVANSPWAQAYHILLNEVIFRFGFERPGVFDLELKKSILHMVNDGLMAIFFFLVGLEIKREMVDGQLADKRSALLPVLAAIGGMAVPAGIFYLANRGEAANLAGWAIPSATDIAFALGILALAGSRVPVALKVLLTAIAIIDDLGAIVIIALFYGQGLSVEPLMFAAAALVVLIVMNRMGVAQSAAYVVVGVVMWLGVLESGVHATLAGVVTALCVPLRSRRDPAARPLEDLEHGLQPWVAFGVLPLFAFANAGVSLAGFGADDFMHPVTLGIILGLFVGKQVGIFATLWLVIKMGWARMPDGVNWAQLYALAVLCGIGFTMSLFIGGLAYAGPEMQVAVRVGVLAGSVLSGVAGFVILKRAVR